jgi:hypothetical protein
VVPVSGEPVEKEPVAGSFISGEAPLQLRVGHLLRIESYLDYATLSMWTGRRAEVVMGMAEASVRGTGPGGENGPDEELLVVLRALIREAREYHALGDFPAAMARMRVASDLVSLHLVRLVGW